MTRFSSALPRRAFVVAGLCIAEPGGHPGTLEHAVGQLTLPDGRVVEWADYGAPGGTPVFYLHGGGSSSLEAADFDPNAIQPPVQFVTGVDDPGAAYAAEWVRRLPQATLHVVPGGHLAILVPAVRHQLMEVLAAAANGSHERRP